MDASSILLSLTVVGSILGLGAWNDRNLLAELDERDRLIQTAEARSEVVCGTGGELARLSDGLACLHETPAGRLVARDAPEPLHIARRP